MSQLTCESFLQLNTMQQVMSVVWYEGWIAQKKGMSVFVAERDRVFSQKESLITTCEASKNELVLTKLQITN